MNPAVAQIRERREQVGGLEVFWREADPPVGVTPTLYVHGVPTSSDEWPAFLERTGGVAPDLPGFGRSAKPADFDYSIPGYRRFLSEFVDRAGLDRFSLVVHDWGGVGLTLAQQMPERLDRLLIFNCVPLFDSYRWHRLARIWRTPLLGELFMGFTFRWSFKRLSRESNFKPGPLPDDFIDDFYRWFDHGTQRAILKLYRADRTVTAPLDAVTAPALVVWGEKDPYLGPEWADRIAAALGGPAEVETVPDAGHWPWLDVTEIVQRVADFLVLSAT
jgi:pimeloyl-ACP methyl ester carboxylesterase